MGYTGTCCLKCLLIFVNITLGVLGLALLGLGIFMKVAANSLINKDAGDVLTGITQLSSSNNMTTESSALAQVDFTIVLEPVAILFIVVGSVIAFVSFLGAFGACCDSKCLLGTYIAVLILLIAGQLVVASLFFTKMFDAPIRAGLQSTLTDHYVDLDDVTVYSLTWNYIMFDFNCCGLDGYQDFNSARVWRRTHNFSVDNSTTLANLTTPLACCKVTGSFPDVQLVNNTCAVSPNDVISNWNTGCWKQVTAYLSQYNNYLIIAVASLLFFETLVALIAIAITCNIEEDAKNSQAL